MESDCEFKLITLPETIGYLATLHCISPTLEMRMLWAMSALTFLQLILKNTTPHTFFHCSPPTYAAQSLSLKDKSSLKWVEKWKVEESCCRTKYAFSSSGRDTKNSFENLMLNILNLEQKKNILNWTHYPFCFIS